MFPTILIVDDETSILKTLSGILSDEGFETITASNGYEALKILDAESPDLVLLDIWMPGMDGIDTLKEIRKIHPTLQVIMITGHGTVETAVTATKIGAFDFIEKPISIDKVIVGINNALNFRRLEEENRYLRKKSIEETAINGSSPLVQALLRQIHIAAPTDAWILITGEQGTGKERVARMIHRISARSETPMIDVNCAAIPDDRFENELLGHEKGAFVEATAKKRGKLELADKGILFLDEIGEIGPNSQALLLRVLEEKKFQRIGGERTLTADVRIIAATSKDLQAEVDAGRFRQDLYFRLNVVPVAVPPLRDRKDDIGELARVFLARLAEKHHTAPKHITPEAVAVLQSYAWPGNVRELKNLIERLEIAARSSEINADDIPEPYNPGKTHHNDSAERFFAMDHLDEARKAFEMEYIRRKLRQNDNNIPQTARQIDVDKRYVQKIAKQLGKDENQPAN
jgi:two-component system, NtrC family, nitrogen regulation response regulator NtrX